VRKKDIYKDSRAKNSARVINKKPNSSPIVSLVIIAIWLVAQQIFLLFFLFRIRGKSSNT
jgi:hypothetical protein